MNNKTKRIAVIPAYQPENTFYRTAEQLKEKGFIIIAVDDGSGENYKKRFECCKDFAVILTHEKNRGKGAALKTGMSYAMKNIEPPFILVTADADGQHLTEDIMRVCDEAESERKSLVLGSRRLDDGTRIPLRSRFGNTVTRLVFRLSSGVSVYDTQTGLRAFTDELLPIMLEIPGERYEYEMNVLLEFAKRKIPIKEIVIKTVYLNGNETSHFDTVKDSCRIYKEILKFSASSLTCFGADYLLFCLLSALTGSVTAANIVARVFSSTLNFSLNRKMVFKSDNSLVSSAAGYFSLAAGILVCNTLLVNALTSAGISAYIAKVMTEITLFAVSWLVQHKLIFGKERAK